MSNVNWKSLLIGSPSLRQCTILGPPSSCRSQVTLLSTTCLQSNDASASDDSKETAMSGCDRCERIVGDGGDGRKREIRKLVMRFLPESCTLGCRGCYRSNQLRRDEKGDGEVGEYASYR